MLAPEQAERQRADPGSGATIPAPDRYDHVVGTLTPYDKQAVSNTSAMFTSQNTLVAPLDEERLLNSPEKLDGIINDTAQFLSEVLQIVDDEVMPCKTLAEVSRIDVLHLFDAINSQHHLRLMSQTYDLSLIHI